MTRTPHTPRQPNKFALFVKENYDSVKKSAKGLKHKEIMGKLSEAFAQTKITWLETFIAFYCGIFFQSFNKHMASWPLTGGPDPI